MLRPVIAFIRTPALAPAYRKLCAAWTITRFTHNYAIIYLDDLLVLVIDIATGEVLLSAVVDLYNNLGLVIKSSKSVLTPARFVKHLGFLLDCELHLITLPESRIAKMTSLCTNLLQSALVNKRLVRRRTFAKVIGYA